MAINFAAANMAGYNNPELQVIPVTFDNETNIPDITYNDVVKLLSNNVVPTLLINAGDFGRILLYLSGLPLQEKIEFASLATAFSTISGTSKSSSFIWGLRFAPDADPELFNQQISTN